jgi:DNA-binding CsgD family transcriptional regulator
MSDRLRLSDVRRVFRLVGEVRALGADPVGWRPHMVLALRRLVRAEIVVASEIHFRKAGGGKMRVVDIGWGSDPDGKVWKIHNEQDDEQPANFWLAAAAGPGDGGKADAAKGEAGAGAGNGGGGEGDVVPVRPTQKMHGGQYLILSQYPLPHAERRLVRLFHVELGRLWRRDALRRAKDPATDLPPRLSQTLNELLAGSSEKQIASKLELSRHTVHNYVKALHQRFGVSSRGELLARAGREKNADFTPRLSLGPRE